MRYALRIAGLAITAAGSIFGQYAGPAILSRGEAPVSISMPNIQFRPFLSVAESYDTGLAGVAVTDDGQLADTAAFGTRIGWGVSGSHAWRHTQLGLSYTGSYTNYQRRAAPQGANQSFLFNLSHQFNHRIRITATEAAGLFTRDYTGATLAETVQFDPSQSNIPTTDYFDNRTIYLNSHVNLAWQKTARLSFSLGGTNGTTVRHSAALANAATYGAYGDAQYRLTRRITVGGVYHFDTYRYSRVSGSTDAHTAAASFSMRMSRRNEFSAYAGVTRVESKFIQTVPIDPAIAALLGIATTPQIFHSIGYHPTVSGRLSRSLYHGIVYGNAALGVSGGNGLFLTSYQKTISGGYAYTGLRHWSANASMNATWSRADANVSGDYRTSTATLALSRRLTSALFLTLNGSARQYGSAAFHNYNRLIYTFDAGISFSPGELPLRAW